MLLQYDAPIEKQFIPRFHPVFLKHAPSEILITSDYDIDMALRRTLIFISLPSVEDVTDVQSWTRTTADEEYPYENSFISPNSLIPSCWYATHTTGRNGTKCILLVLADDWTHCWSRIARHESEKLRKQNLSVRSYFYQKISAQTRRANFENWYCHTLKYLPRTIAEYFL